MRAVAVAALLALCSAVVLVQCAPQGGLPPPAQGGPLRPVVRRLRPRIRPGGAPIALGGPPPPPPPPPAPVEEDEDYDDLQLDTLAQSPRPRPAVAAPRFPLSARPAPVAAAPRFPAPDEEALIAAARPRPAPASLSTPAAPRFPASDDELATIGARARPSPSPSPSPLPQPVFVAAGPEVPAPRARPPPPPPPPQAQPPRQRFQDNAIPARQRPPAPPPPPPQRAPPADLQQVSKPAPSGGRGNRGRPVAQVIRKYREDNEDGSITWGFENDDGTWKEETIGADCVVKGRYGYTDPDGQRREFAYESGSPCDRDALQRQEQELEGDAGADHRVLDVEEIVARARASRPAKAQRPRF